ncbi:di-trans,poly-cis-decaprenylcistransferase [Psittacicella hinzii]|uniref:Ditrans,polycis-undecaprenyl-diphosphate synthase ((2E,6E)-farnesyl-diphosphate specific) n=1 Tax=Psittacicella hinzii TaxID=2028575 RepID=A0A3A1Y592_9GAMM|nr:polyprenyl diphosphate synthase [Psittacicella hinzii]RIY33423.1 di-trans,poly-cis-decaprenylcistransferase [Psittacicella hinzii]
MQVNTDNLPKHVAIIMDGSRRWAKERNKSRHSGHNAGAIAVRKTIEHAVKLGLTSLSLYAFSKENWKRPQEEIDHLMKLFLRVLKGNEKFLLKNNIKLNPIGDVKEFSHDLQLKLDSMVKATSKCTGLTLNIALNYSGRWDIINSTQNIVNKLLDDLTKSLDNKKELLDKITQYRSDFNQEEFLQKIIEENLTVSDQPPIDLIIRTSNEQRISNFFLWQAAYSEFVFLEEYWPDFNGQVFDRAIEIYSKRVRRFGGV